MYQVTHHIPIRPLCHDKLSAITDIDARHYDAVAAAVSILTSTSTLTCCFGNTYCLRFTIITTQLGWVDKGQCVKRASTYTAVVVFSAHLSIPKHDTVCQYTAV